MKLQSNGFYGFLAGLLVAAGAVALIFFSGALGSTDDAETTAPRRKVPTATSSFPTPTPSSSYGENWMDAAATRDAGNEQSISNIYDEYPIKVVCTGDLYEEGIGFGQKLVGQCEMYAGFSAAIGLAPKDFRNCIKDPDPPMVTVLDKKQYFICQK